MSAPPAYTKILIKDLVLMMSIGIHSHEKTQKQRVMINVELYTGNTPPENIEDAVCYETLSNQITAACGGHHYDLVETLAEDLARLCLKNPKIKSVCLRIEKPDIMENGACVGVEIFRTR